MDIVKAAAEKAGLNIEVRAMDWATAQDMVRRGEADALIQINKSKERKKIFDFSNKLLNSEFAIFHRRDRIDITDLDSLHGRKVGV